MGGEAGGSCGLHHQVNGSWWLTKYEPIFAYTVIVGGVLMGLSLAGQVAISLYEMWFPTIPEARL